MNRPALSGFSAPGLLDLRPTPISAVFSGVEVHATMLDNLLSKDFIRPMPMIWTVILILVIASAGGILVSIASGPGAKYHYLCSFSSAAIRFRVPLLFDNGLVSGFFGINHRCINARRRRTVKLRHGRKAEKAYQKRLRSILKPYGNRRINR